MDKKKRVFFGAILIDILLACLGYAVFYGKIFDDAATVAIAWIVIVGGTFMMIITIGLAVVIPKGKIKIRRKKKKKNKEEELTEFKEFAEDKQQQPEEIPEFKVVEDEKENIELEHTTSKSGIVKIRRVVTKEDIDEIEEHVDHDKINFKDEMQKVIDNRTKKVEDVVDELIHSKMEKKGKNIEEIRSKMEKKKRRPVQDKIYKYMEKHPTARPSDVRKAAKCKLSTARKFRNQWLKKNAKGSSKGSK